MWNHTLQSCTLYWGTFCCDLPRRRSKINVQFLVVILSNAKSLQEKTHMFRSWVLLKSNGHIHANSALFIFACSHYAFIQAEQLWCFAGRALGCTRSAIAICYSVHSSDLRRFTSTLCCSCPVQLPTSRYCRGPTKAVSDSQWASGGRWCWRCPDGSMHHENPRSWDWEDSVFKNEWRTS